MKLLSKLPDKSHTDRSLGGRLWGPAMSTPAAARPLVRTATVVARPGFQGSCDTGKRG